MISLNANIMNLYILRVWFTLESGVPNLVGKITCPDTLQRGGGHHSPAKLLNGDGAGTPPEDTLPRITEDGGIDRTASQGCQPLIPEHLGTGTSILPSWPRGDNCSQNGLCLKQRAVPRLPVLTRGNTSSHTVHTGWLIPPALGHSKGHTVEMLPFVS